MALRLGTHLMSLHSGLLWEPVARRVRATLDGVPVLDSVDAALVWEPRRVVPMYAVPPEDLVATLDPRRPTPVPDPLPPVLGPVNFGWHTTPGRSFDLVVGHTRVTDSAFAPDDPDLGGRVVVEWSPFDWVEEATDVTGHPHDPFKRIDLLAADRHVVVAVDGVVLADTHRATAVHETHIPTRWYLPSDDVRLDLLVPSASTTTCAYKGDARYWSLPAREGRPAVEDVAWSYPDPLPEVAALRDLVCFYAERTDLVVDGEPVPRPVTPWSSPADQERS
ncbi:DUF427 domain-containing protein [Phycicoccus sp. MAQZ13P-2]|uniref:DUF427 domain-containing protein n=1 Tax=Phycicoccus mangrovi TaxID=2840470 RepID=UPI001BFFE444|nr:DUF427 domain-containing protein [Phycicoccus mangrovi]MBT9255826.1 DUF427 domain-containing protein [Phycicoccus mangrovi]MBT9274420.1 DUF427 domain-containing protein [Phycicoccus mangrovi]